MLSRTELSSIRTSFVFFFDGGGLNKEDDVDEVVVVDSVFSVYSMFCPMLVSLLSIDCLTSSLENKVTSAAILSTKLLFMARKIGSIFQI